MIKFSTDMDTKMDFSSGGQRKLREMNTATICNQGGKTKTRHEEKGQKGMCTLEFNAMGSWL
jgi:hypothetical protein